MSEKQVKRLRRMCRATNILMSNCAWRYLKRAWRRNPKGFDLALEAASARRADFVSKMRAMHPRQARRVLEKIQAGAPSPIAEGFERMLKAMGKLED